MGRNCPEALGDYLAGPNHTLPTSGTAKFSSPLSVDDFVKKSQYTYYTEEAFNKISNKVAYFAEKEGLSAHAWLRCGRLIVTGGEIMDEFDPDNKYLTQISEREWMVDGRFSTDDAIELGWPVEDTEEYETIDFSKFTKSAACADEFVNVAVCNG